jgi:phosphate uptake regulator
MDVRKIQKVGYSTLAISLPKDWTKKMGLSVGDLVSFQLGPDNIPRLYPGVVKEDAEAKTCVIYVDNFKEDNLTLRTIIACYVIGYETIKVESKNILEKKVLEDIRTAARRLMGMEILEQTPNTVSLQCFVDPKKFHVDTLINKEYLMIKSMLELCIHAIDGNEAILEEINKMGEEVDKIYTLLVRVLLTAIDFTDIKKLGLSSIKNIAGDRVVAKTLEDVGDEIEVIGDSLVTVIKNKHKVNKDILEGIQNTLKSVLNIMDNTVEAFLTGDVIKSNRILNEKKQFIKKCQSLQEESINKISDTLCVVNISNVLWVLVSISKSLEALSEITINRKMEDKTNNIFIGDLSSKTEI